MKLSNLLFLGISTLALTAGYAQENGVLQNINGKLISYQKTRSPEKTYIHTDKDVYLNGETVWYKVYLVDGISHIVSDKSRVVYLELLNASDSTAVKQKLFTDTIGASGNIDLPETIEEGVYTLRAYTKYMLNEEEPVVFSKQISIWRTENAAQGEVGKPQNNTVQPLGAPKHGLALDFFPEGGNLVYGIQGTMGIKITDTKGNEILTRGRIIDQNNTNIQQFETFEYGLGKFTYLPETGNTYYASIVVDGQEKKYALPLPERNGYVLNLVHSREQITIKVTSNIPDGLKGSLLVGHLRGRIFFRHVRESSSASYMVKFPIGNMADGVAHFTLFSPQGEPVCERLAFIDNPGNDDVLKIETPLPIYKKRQKVDVALNLKSTGDWGAVGSFSAAVIAGSGQKNDAVQNIESWLLLNSDVGGTVDNAGFFFEEDTAKKRYLLDALMLTHGWRRFVWKELLDANVWKPRPFEPERGIMVEGKTTDFRNKYRSKASLVSINLMGTEQYWEEKNTDSNGNFTFGPYFFQDSILASIASAPATVSNRTSQNELAVLLDEIHPILPYKAFRERLKNGAMYKFPREYVALATQKRIVDFNIDPKTIELEEVTVAAEKKSPGEILDEKMDSITIHGRPDARFIIDSITDRGAMSIFDLMRNVPGVLINFAEQTILIRRKKPLILLDGVRIEQRDANFLSLLEIDFVDVLKRPNIYDRETIAIYTKGRLNLGTDKPEPLPNIANVIIKGFYKGREFYSPRYDVPEQNHKHKDFRTTLHWQPDIAMDSNGTANMAFFTGDVAGTYLIHVEGITANGVPVSTVQTFEVEDL